MSADLQCAPGRARHGHHDDDDDNDEDDDGDDDDDDDNEEAKRVARRWPGYARRKEWQRV
jgi:hypothetical protein